MIVVLCGIGTLFGPIVGTFVMVPLEVWLAAVTEHWPLVIAAFVILAVVLLPNGIAGPIVRVGRAAPTRAGEDG